MWVVLWESVLIKVLALVVINGNTIIAELRCLNMLKFRMAQNSAGITRCQYDYYFNLSKFCVIASCCSIHAMKL